MEHDDELTFTAVLRREGPLYLVDVPTRVTRALGKGSGRVPVVLTAGGGGPVQSTLVPRGGGAHKVFLNADTRGDAGAKLGGEVTIAVRFDDDARDVDVPGDVSAALREAGALATFLAQTPAKQRHILDWVDEVRSDDARERRVAKVVERMLEVAEKRADRAAAREKKRAR
ncbi:MAG TPA: YdeI/OmpD-associated family protein [Byssovorax sp.]